MLRCFVAFAAAVVAVLVVVPPAFAHGLVGKQDLPIPQWLFAWGAAIVLVVSFAALALLWPQPRWERRTARRLVSVPRLLDPLAGALGVALFAVAVYAGLAGNQSARDNLLPTLVFVLFWVGLPILSALFGDVFRAFN